MGGAAGQARGGSRRACGSDRPGRGAVAARRAVHRVSGAALGRASVRPGGAATAVAISSCFTVWNTAQGSGPFVRESITDSVLASQLFVAVAALTSLVLAAVTAERSASETAQQALTAEQAALRRIATLVAGEAASDARVRAGTAEAARTVGALAASLARFDEDDTVVFVGGWSESGTLAFPVGSRLPLGETGVLAAVRASGEPQRIDRYEGRAGQVIERFTSFGYGSATAAPVKLGGAGLGRARRGRTAGRLRSRLGRSAGSWTSPTSSRRRWRTPRPTRSSLPHARGSSRRPTPSAGGWSETCTTARSNGWSRSRSSCGSSRRPCSETRGGGNAPRRSRQRARAGARRAPRARARDPPGSPQRPRPRSRSPRARRARARPCHAHPNPRRPATRPVEAAIYYLVAEAITNIAKYAQATEASVAVERSNGIATVVVSDDGVGGAQPGSGLRTGRPRRSRRGARRPAPSRQPARSGHPPLRRDSLRLTDAPCDRWRDDPGVTLSFLLQI